MPDPGAPVTAHRDRILGLIEPLSARSVPLPDALGLALADDAVASLPVPPFDHAAMDGYAVKVADVASASASSPVSLPVAGVVVAGDAWSGDLVSGTAVRIMTGAPVPAGADAVVPFEWTDRGVDRVSVHRPIAANRHIRRAGEDVAAGAVAVVAGTVMAPRHLGFLASVGCAEVVVRPRPRVAVIATGAELVASYGTFDLPDGAVPDSNSITVAGAVRAAGGDPVVLGPAPDEPAAFLEVLEVAAAEADLVVTTGGISAGDHDVAKAALRDRDGMWFGPVAVKPGRPQGAGLLDVAEGRRVPVVCLPGTPVAAYSSFLLFAAPAIRALAGRPAPADVVATLAGPLEVSPDRTAVLPGRYDASGAVDVLPGHAGHSQRLLAEAEVLIVAPSGDRPLAAGTEVNVVRLDPEV